MNSLDLINAMADGKSLEMEQAFNAIVSERLAGKINDLKLNVAAKMFTSEVEETTEAE